jgi:hypothetical protein
MSMNPATMERVVQTRIIEMRRAAAKRPFGGRRPVARRTAGTRRPLAQSGVAFPAAPRRAVGWFLVRVGLRLALPRPRSASAQ